MSLATAIENLERGEIHIRQDSTKKRSELKPAEKPRPFAGRIGGNQEFTLTPNDACFDETVAKLPDAAATFTWKQSFRLSAFADVDLWKEATVEGVGTCLQIFLAGLYAKGLRPAATATSLGPIVPAILGAGANCLLISLFIFAGAPVSGGHFNPLITLSTFFARLAIFPRTLLYIVFQCSGSLIAGVLLRASIGSKLNFQEMPGCHIATPLVTPGQAFVLETMTSFAYIYIAFGVGLEPRQRQVFGPALSPILIGFSLALCNFASGIGREGYTGASLNPARCLGLMTAGESYSYHYIHWLGDLTAAGLNGLLYWAIPVYKS